MNTVEEKILALIKNSPLAEWDRYNWSTNYVNKIAKHYWRHEPTGMLLIIAFSSENMEFDLENFLHAEYGHVDRNDSDHMVKILNTEAANEIILAFETLLKRGKSVTELTVERNIGQYLKDKHVIV